MNKKFSLIVAALLFFALPLSAAAKSHEKHDHGHKPGDHGGMVMLGEQTVDGVKAMAHLDDVKAAMAKVGMKETHHLMVAFVDAAGNQLVDGTVAVKIVDPSGKEGAPIKLIGMDGHFGADILLAAKGKYAFKVGTKLPDGITRQYEFETSIK